MLVTIPYHHTHLDSWQPSLHLKKHAIQLSVRDFNPSWVAVVHQTVVTNLLINYDHVFSSSPVTYHSHTNNEPCLSGNKGKPRCYMSSIAKNVFHRIWHTLKFLLCLASRCLAQCQRLSLWVATVHSTALATVPMAHGHEISQEINGCTISEQCLSKNKLTEVCDISCGIVHRFIHNLYDVWSVQFRHLLAQLGVRQFLEDVLARMPMNATSAMETKVYQTAYSFPPECVTW